MSNHKTETRERLNYTVHITIIKNRNFKREHKPSAAPQTNHPYIQSEIPHSSP